MESWRKKEKMLKKKARLGTIHTHEHYEACIFLGITAESSISIRKDPTRTMSKHDLTISELRDLIFALLMDKTQIPKQFEIKNPQFFRDVVVIHFSNCESLMGIGRRSNGLLGCVRNFKKSMVNDFSHRLLTVSMNKAADFEVDSALSLGKRNRNDCIRHPLEPYVLSESSMRTWGYPLPLKNCEPYSSAKLQSRHRPMNGSSEDPVSSSESVDKDNNICGFVNGNLRLPSPSFAKKYLSKNCCNLHLVPPHPDKRHNHISEEMPLLNFISTSDEYTDLSFLKDGISSKDSLMPDLSLISIDCEMCETENGIEVTRVSLIDYNGILLMDTYVKPYARVVDYKEEFSGVNESLLEPVNVRLEQVQLALLSIISPSTLLAGHSLENDLYALRLIHYRCIDTSVLFPHRLGFPHRKKLKSLAKEYLNLNIQNSRSNASGLGHSSVEDARVVLQLIKLKLERGPMFGLATGQDYPRTPIMSMLPVDKVVSAFFFEAEIRKKRKSILSSDLNPVCGVDNEDTLSRAIQHLEKVSGNHDVVNVRNFTYLEFSCNDYQKTNLKSVNSFVESKSNEKGLYNCVARVQGCLEKKSNRNTLLIVTCQSSTQAVTDLQHQKILCSRPQSASSWSSALEEELQKKILSCSYSEVEFFAVSGSGR